MAELDHGRLSRQLRRPRFEELLDTRRRRTRRTRVAMAAAATAAVAVVAAGALAGQGPSTGTDLPPVDRTQTPTSTPTPDAAVPEGQQTIVPDVGPGDVHGFDVLATVTSSQPAHRGASELTAVVPDTREAVSTYCRGAADLYYFLDIGDGGGAYDHCTPDADTSLAPEVDISDEVWEDPPGAPQTIRMWIARPSQEWLRCQREGHADCTLAEVPALANPDVEFGFEVYAHESTLAFQLLEDAGNGAPHPIQALATVDGAGWLVDRAVVAAPGAGRLVAKLSASARDYLVDVYQGVGRHLDRCLSAHADELPDQVSTDRLVYEAAVDKACGVDLRLLVDGRAVSPAPDPSSSGHFTELGALLSAGTEHDLVVEVTRGDPRDVQYAVVVRRRAHVP